MTGFLHMGHDHHLDEMADMEAICGRIKADMKVTPACPAIRGLPSRV
jgi:hypothetical protein